MKKINCLFTLIIIGSLASPLWGQSTEIGFKSFCVSSKELKYKDYCGTITGTNISIIVPNKTDVTALIPVMTVPEGVAISPGPGMQNFSTPVHYSLTKKRTIIGTKSEDWTVTVTVAEPADIAVISVSGGGQGRTIPGTISGTDISITVPAGTNVKSLTPSITLPKGTTISPAPDGVQDFTKPVTYTATAADGSQKVYTVAVTVATTPGKGKTVPFNVPADGISFNMVYVPVPKEELSFLTADEYGGSVGDAIDKKENVVKVDKPYLIGETVVTLDLWSKVTEWAVKSGYTLPTSASWLAQLKAEEGVVLTDKLRAAPIGTWWDAMVWANALTEYYNAKNGTKYTCAYYSDKDYKKPIRAYKYANKLYSVVDTNPGAQDNPYVYANATGFRMLTNAEWECAARYQGDSSAYGAYEYPVGSGYWWTPGNYASGATANYKDEEATSVVASSTPSFTYKMTVKTKKANVLGLYDMSGGIFIWCFDEYKKSGNRLVHGGSYNGPYTENPLTSLQIGCKKYSFPDGWHGMFMNRGFRLAKTAD